MIRDLLTEGILPYFALLPWAFQGMVHPSEHAHPHQRGPHPQSEERGGHPAAQPPHGHHRRERLGKVFLGLRYPTCGGLPPIPRIPFRQGPGDA